MFTLLVLSFLAIPLPKPTPPGTPITLTAEATWDGGSATAQYVVVVESPLPIGRVCAQGAVRHYIDPSTGEQRVWQDKALAGCRVLVPVTGTPYPVEGIVTNRGSVVSGGVEYEWNDLR